MLSRIDEPTSKQKCSFFSYADVITDRCFTHVRQRGHSATLRRGAAQADDGEEGFASQGIPTQRSLTLRRKEERLEVQCKLKSAPILLTSQDPHLSALLQSLLPHLLLISQFEHFSYIPTITV